MFRVIQAKEAIGAPVGQLLARARSSRLVLNGIAGHALFVGLPIAWFAKRVQ
jgi:hypothetical protein